MPAETNLAGSTSGRTAPGFESRGFVADPLDKTLYLGIRQQGFAAIVFAGQLFLAKQRMDLVMTGPTQPEYP